MTHTTARQPYSSEPVNLGADATQLRAALITPVPNFFVRSHAPAPIIAADAYRLHVDGLVDQPCTLTLEELQQGFPVHTVTATLQCAGLRRRELTALEPIDAAEIVWDTDAISTARWTGVRLSDILRRAGVQPAAAHVGFLGLDQVTKTQDGLGGSIPLAKALEDDVLLAYGMNDAPLLPIHGYPLRALVPGYIGARSVKWVGRITLQVAPSTNHFQACSYKLFPSSVRAETANWDEGEMLGALPINSFITSPQAGVLPTNDTWLGARARDCAGRWRCSHRAGRALERQRADLDGGDTHQPTAAVDVVFLGGDLQPLAGEP